MLHITAGGARKAERKRSQGAARQKALPSSEAGRREKKGQKRKQHPPIDALRYRNHRQQL